MIEFYRSQIIIVVRGKGLTPDHSVSCSMNCNTWADFFIRGTCSLIHGASAGESVRFTKHVDHVTVEVSNTTVSDGTTLQTIGRHKMTLEEFEVMKTGVKI